MPDLPWFVYAFPLGMVGLIAVAAIYKYLQVRAAADWPETTGKVVVSEAEVRKVKTFDDDREGGRSEEERNFANIVYEYRVSGQKLRNNRVSIGEDLGNFEVAETIARYPVGKTVTVYYNPRTPGEAVLERDVPKGLWGCIIWIVVIGTLGILGSFFGFNQVTQFLKGHVENAPMVVALSAMGLVTLWFGIAFRKQASAARNWPVAKGRVQRSVVDEFRGRLDHDVDQPVTTLYRPLISYSYEFNGVKYTGTQVSLGMKVTSSSDASAKKLVAKYPAGKTFTVYVNPANPSESVLSPGVSGAWVIWAIAAGLLALAFYVSQHA